MKAYSELILLITARKRSCGKVMFLQVSVILFTGGRGCIPVCLAGGIPACLAGLQGCVSQHAFQVSRPTPKGSLRGLARGVSRPTPRRAVSKHALRQTPQLMATAADGTHPTGMHSCFPR